MDDFASQHGLNYIVRTADIDEKAIRLEDPHQLVIALGRAKRDAILLKLAAETSASGSVPSSNHNANTYLITCDQVVVHGGKILEKPENEEECWQFIR
jgi:septum formation protein